MSVSGQLSLCTRKLSLLYFKVDFLSFYRHCFAADYALMQFIHSRGRQAIDIDWFTIGMLLVFFTLLCYQPVQNKQLLLLVSRHWTSLVAYRSRYWTAAMISKVAVLKSWFVKFYNWLKCFSGLLVVKRFSWIKESYHVFFF